MEEGDVFDSTLPSAKSRKQDKKDAFVMMPYFESRNAYFCQTWIRCCTKNPRAMIFPFSREEHWSSILHVVIVMETAEHLLFACQWLRLFNIDIGAHTYEFDGAACSLLFVASRLSTEQRCEKVKILLEFGATFPEEELADCSSIQWNCYHNVKEVVDAKRARVAHATLVILAMHRVKKPRRTWFQIVGRDMTRLIAQEVFHSGLYLWP